MDAPNVKRDAGRRLAVVALLPLAVVAPFSPWLLDGHLLGARDTARLYAPLRSLVVSAVRSFSLPLWNPYEGTGHPLLAEGIHGALHPVSVAAAWLWPSSMNALLLAYLATGALGAWVLARGLGRSAPAAFLAATAYALSGFVTSMLDNLVFLASAATLPWVVAALRACGRPGRTAMVAAGGAVAAALLAGDAQGTVVGVVLGVALAAEAGGIRAGLRAVTGVGLGALLGAVQLVPSAVHVQRTVRKLALDDASRSEWALSPWRLVELAVPGLFGSRTPVLDVPLFRALGGPTSYTVPFAKSVHVGLATLLLAVRGIRADRTSRILAGAGALLLWLALGPALGASQALGWLPVWGSFRYAEKLVGPLALCVAMLAARGLDRELEDGRRSWVPLAAVAALGVAAVALWGVLPAAVLDQFRTGFWAVAPFNGIIAAALAWTRLTRDWRGWLVAGAAWGLSVAALAWSVHPMPTGCAGPGWLARLAADVPGPRIATPVTREYAPSQPDAWNRTWCELEAIGLPAMNASAGVDQIDVYTGLDPIRFVRVYSAFGDDRWRALRRYGITHVITPPPGDRVDVGLLEGAVAGGAPVATSPGGLLTAWAVPHRPWASFASSASSARTPQPTLERLQDLVARGSDEVVVQAYSTPAVAPGRVLSLRRGRERVEVEGEAAGPALLVVNDAWWPGWAARIDGREVPHYPADVLVRGIPFPAGRHRLVMTYEPPEVAVGLALSALGAAAALALLLVRRRAAQK